MFPACLGQRGEHIAVFLDDDRTAAYVFDGQFDNFLRALELWTLNDPVALIFISSVIIPSAWRKMKMYLIHSSAIFRMRR